MTQSTQPIDFEKSLTELENLVEDLEQGELPLEKALAEFERGVNLTRQCQTALQNAEQKVTVLMNNQTLAPFQAEASEPE